jgi:glycosyltransferase involved in cell wall biosynthesis
MNQKLFSIITPTYNCGLKIEKTINSVLSQSEDLFDFHIIDGNSTDDTLDVIEKYGDGINLISEKDKGVYDAMNKGIDVASGKYLYFLGAGDSLRPNALSEIEKLMPDKPLTFVYGNVYWMDQAIIYSGKFDKQRLRTHNISHQAIFYERSIFEVLGKYELRFKVLADYVFNIKCFGDDRIQKRYIDYVIANFEGGGLSARQKDIDLLNEHAQLIRDYLE